LSADIILFILLAAIAIVSAIAMLVTRNAVHSALFLVLVMTVLAILFLSLGGSFIAMVQVAVYAGAIMVLFLFVIMLLGAERMGVRSELRWQTPAALLLGIVLAATVGLLVFGAMPTSAAGGTSPASIDPIVAGACADDVARIDGLGIVEGTPCLIGDRLFTTYVFPFEVVGVLLLVALVGALTLSRKPKERGV
jgi:NADH-quinone oxidoreductase subunit J